MTLIEKQLLEVRSKTQMAHYCWASVSHSNGRRNGSGFEPSASGSQEEDIELRSEAPKGTRSCLLRKGDVLWLPPRINYGARLDERRTVRLLAMHAQSYTDCLDSGVRA